MPGLRSAGPESRCSRRSRRPGRVWSSAIPAAFGEKPSDAVASTASAVIPAGRVTSRTFNPINLGGKSNPTSTLFPGYRLSASFVRFDVVISWPATTRAGQHRDTSFFQGIATLCGHSSPYRLAGILQAKQISSSPTCAFLPSAVVTQWGSVHGGSCRTCF